MTELTPDTAWVELAEAFELQPTETLLQAAARVHSEIAARRTRGDDNADPESIEVPAILVLRSAGLVPPLQSRQLLHAALVLQQLRSQPPRLQLVINNTKGE